MRQASVLQYWVMLWSLLGFWSCFGHVAIHEIHDYVSELSRTFGRMIWFHLIWFWPRPNLFIYLLCVNTLPLNHLSAVFPVLLFFPLCLLRDTIFWLWSATGVFELIFEASVSFKAQFEHILYVSSCLSIILSSHSRTGINKLVSNNNHDHDWSHTASVCRG